MARQTKEAVSDRATERRASFLRIVPTLHCVPIEDCFTEKRFIEAGEWNEYYLHLYGHSSLVDGLPRKISQKALNARIVEVYRFCYRASADAKRERVLASFVAHFPDLIWNADWFTQLARKLAKTGTSGRNSRRARLYRAIANGFKKAADSKPGDPSTPKCLFWLARMLCDELRLRLSEWKESNDWTHASPEARKGSAGEKAAALSREYPALAPCVERLANYLEKGQLYRASTFIFSREYGIPERDLQGNRSR
jgi:hypothetical protein